MQGVLTGMEVRSHICDQLSTSFALGTKDSRIIQISTRLRQLWKALFKGYKMAFSNQ